MILSVAMLLEWLNHPELDRGAAAIREAVTQVCSDPANRTPDLGGSLSTTDMGDRIADRIAAR